jgi:serine/threonine-protein kinase RsbW
MTRPRLNEDNVELRVPCKPEYVRIVRTVVGEMADSIPLSPEAVEEVKVAVSEAVANIVRHAYGGCPATESVIVRCSAAGGNLSLEIIDKGIGFKVPAVGLVPSLDVTREKEGGLGIVLIRTLMDSVDYMSKPNFGTRIKMTKNGWSDGDHRSPDHVAGLLRH